MEVIQPPEENASQDLSFDREEKFLRRGYYLDHLQANHTFSPCHCEAVFAEAISLTYEGTSWAINQSPPDPKEIPTQQTDCIDTGRKIIYTGCMMAAIL
jgi:hypothetical protein